MTKTNETLKFDHVKLENRLLADSELDVVSGAATIKEDPVNAAANAAIAAVLRSLRGS